MHELLLYGQVPVTRHEQVLKILAGIAAMQPQTVLERQLVLKPAAVTEQVKVDKRYPNKTVKPQTLVYHQLIQKLKEQDFGKESSFTTAGSWSMRAQEMPEPETKTLVLRPVRESELLGENVQKMLASGEYSCVNEFFIEGHLLVHNNTVLTLFRLLRASDGQAQNSPMTMLPLLDSLTPLDPSGCFVLEARIRIDDRSKPKLVSAATDELNGFRDMMRGSVDMRAPDRLALDTRVR